MKCLFCGCKFPVVAKLEQHYRTHIKERPYLCPKCPKELSSKRSLNDHLDTHKPREERDKIECHFCGNLFLTKHSLKAHIRHNHEQEGSFECKICGKKLANPGNLKRHENQHTSRKTFACSTCHKLFNSKQYLKKHEEGVHGKMKHSCHVCGEMIKKFNFSRHMKRHAPQRERFQCGDCTKSFLDKGAFKDHRLIHQGQDYSFECCKCDKRYRTLGKLKEHKRLSHLETKSILECVFCGKQFPNFCIFQLHMAKHTLERSRLCKLCPAEFMESNGLRYHNERIHSKKGVHFKCDMCSKSFQRKCFLNDHIRGHLGEFYLKCSVPECDKRFVSNNHRRRHFLRVHVGKKFSCKFCGKEFLEKGNLKRHERTLHALQIN